MKAIAADPHHSQVWQSITKDVANMGKLTREIPEMVADTLKLSYSCNIQKSPWVLINQLTIQLLRLD
jgi:hypothetical protein